MIFDESSSKYMEKETLSPGNTGLSRVTGILFIKIAELDFCGNTGLFGVTGTLFK